MGLSNKEIIEICRSIPYNLYIEESGLREVTILDRGGPAHITIYHSEPHVAETMAKLFVEVPKLLPQLLLRLEVTENELEARK